MIIGLDFWGVISHYPEYFKTLAEQVLAAGGEVHVISAIGKGRTGTIEQEVRDHGVPFTAVHEVVFTGTGQSPVLKTAKALELGLEVFYDDRPDVCKALHDAGILAMTVGWRGKGNERR